MQFYREDGEVIHNARIAFNTNPGEVTHIRQLAIIEGSSTDDLRTYPIENYLIEVKQPFWISLCDHVYLNPEFAYGSELIDWIKAFVADRTDVPVQVSMAHRHSLEGLIELSPDDEGRYLSGRPIWRRGALSCAPNVSVPPPSALSKNLSNAIYAQLIVSELVARFAMQHDRTRRRSRFARKGPRECTELAKAVLSRALGYAPGTTGENKNESESEHIVGDRELGVERLIFGKAGYLVVSALRTAQRLQFKKHYSISQGSLSDALDMEIVDFIVNPRAFNEQFDASALVAWSANSLIALRIAFAASLDFDDDQNFHKTIINEKRTNAERLDVAQRDMIKHFKVVTGRRGGKLVRFGIEQLLDLQYTTMVAFMANVNPSTLSPMFDYRVFSTDDPEMKLTPYLYLCAQWLGNLFRGRRLELNVHQAHALVGYGNPDMLPSDLPPEHREDWLVATRMMTSFMTEIGRVRLFESAEAVLDDRQPRMIYLRPIARLELPEDPAQVAATARTLEALRARSNSTIHLPDPVFVEAGWLVLPGNYTEDWFEQSDPFEDTDFPG